MAAATPDLVSTTSPFIFSVAVYSADIVPVLVTLLNMVTCCPRLACAGCTWTVLTIMSPGILSIASGDPEPEVIALAETGAEAVVKLFSSP